jgi:TolB-like protein
MTFKFLPPLCFILFLGLISACSAIGTSPVGSSNIQSKTYSAVDRLLKQSQINQNTPLLVGTLNDINTMETSSTLGRVISEQISGRLSQRKYNVTELKTRQSVNIKRGLDNAAESGEFLMSRDLQALSTEHKASKVITGTYAIAGKQIMVNLKMIDIATGKILGARDYELAIDSNTSKLIQNSGDSLEFYGSSMAY